MTPDKLSVYACWEKARQEYPDDSERRKARYVELMREQRHIVDGKHEPLPCGYSLHSFDDLLTPEGRAQLNADLHEIATKRRRAMDGWADRQMP